MSDERRGESFFIVPERAGEPLLAAVERGLREADTAAVELPALTGIAAADPFLAAELAALHSRWELRPRSGPGLVARLRTRLAWWLLGPELAQASALNASLVRVIDSLTAHLDAERDARLRIEAHLRDGGTGRP